MPLDSIDISTEVPALATPPEEFQPFPKIARLKRTCVVTEKIDGTNAQIFISEGGAVYAGSRTRWISPGKSTDNFGFAAWVRDNAEELMKLGPGRHYGEWWGSGIQRGYGQTEKKFSLFAVHRWANNPNRPDCCGVVPVLYEGDFDTLKIDAIVGDLERNGSVAAPGFSPAEGIVIYHVAAKTFYKRTLEKDEEFKGVKGHAGDGPNA